MLSYIIRRLFYMVPIVVGVNFITFALFFMVNSPDDMARMRLGQKYVTQEAVERWKVKEGYDKPLFYNEKEQGANKIFKTLFYTKSLELFLFNFGSSDRGRDISYDIGQRMWPSLYLAVPSLVLGLFVNITFALMLALFRGTLFDTLGTIFCVVVMSISGLFYVIFGQFLFGSMLQLVPISGYQEGQSAFKFLILPILIGVFSAMGATSRWYRSIFLEEFNREYVRTARSKGLSEFIVLYKHILKNALIPILTGVVALLPTLFMGSLIMESFFGIPGLGGYTLEAINDQDFDIVRVMVYLGTVLYIIGLILTDISYTLVDPRVKFK